MNTFEVQPLISLSLKPNTGTGDWRRYSEILQEQESWPLTANKRLMLLAIELFEAAAGASGSIPVLSLEIADSVNSDAWETVWSSVDASGDAYTSRFVNLNLMADVPRGQPYRLAKIMRWRVTFPAVPTTTASRISFRIIASAE